MVITHHLQLLLSARRLLKFFARGAWFHFLFYFLAELSQQALSCVCALNVASRPEGLQTGKVEEGAICVIDADWLPVPLGIFVMASQKKDLLYWVEHWSSHCVFSVQRLWLWTTTQALLDRKALRAELGGPVLWPPQKRGFDFHIWGKWDKEERFLSCTCRGF